MKRKFKKKLEKLGKILLTLVYTTYYFVSPATALIVNAASSGDIQNSPVVATNGKGENEQGYIKVTKTITRDENDPEGVYTVNFNIKGNKYEETHLVPSYTIFVLDTSDSMDDYISTGWFSGTTRFSQAKAAIKAASAKLVENPNGHVALIQFGTDSDPDKIVGFKSTALVDSDFKQSWGGTNYDAGLMNAQTLLDTVMSQEGVKNIIFISDGKPTVGLVKHQTISNYTNWYSPSTYTYESYFDDYYYATSDGTTYLNDNTIKNVTIQGFRGRESGSSLRDAKATFNDINYTRNNTLPKLKNTLKGSNNNPHNNIYSFSYLVTATDEQNILKKIATNDANGNPRWKNVNADTIVSELDKIADEISQSAAGVGATLTDEVGLDFNVIDNGNFTVVDGNMSAEIGEIHDGEGTNVSFKIKINPYASTGDHDTNGAFDLKYKVNSSDTTYQHVTTEESPSIYWVAAESKVTVHYYLDGTETKLADDNESPTDVVTQTNGTRTTYAAPVADIYGYTFDKTKTVVKDGTTTVASTDYSVDDNGQATVKYYIDGTTVNYYYTKNNAEVTSPEASKSGDTASVKKTINDNFNYQVNYKTTINDYIGNVTVTITDTLPFAIDTTKDYSLNGGNYDADTKTITWTETIAVDEQHKDINITKNISLYYKDINNATVTNNVNVLVKEGTTTIDDEDANYTNTIGSGTVIVAHQDTKGVTLAPSTTYNGLAGEAYNHQNEDETIYGYTVKSRTPDKSTGSFTDGTITVIYVYEKNSGTLTESLTKSANPTTNTFDGQFGYTLNYTATIDNYVGNATLIIRDTPQYKITAASAAALENGDNYTVAYDAENNIITWTFNDFNIDSEHKSISLSLTYNVYFDPNEVNYNANSNVIENTATSNLTTHGEEDDTTTNSASASVSLKVSYITEVYKCGDETLDTKGPTPNLVNKSYTMEEKEFYGYTHASHDKVVTSYGEQDVTITHTYTKNDPVIEDEDVTLTKSGDRDTKNVNSEFNYTISYEAEVPDYVGTLHAVVTDTLPFAVDTNKEYDLNGGTLSTDKKTITWEQDFEITAPTEEGEVPTIEINKTIKVSYVGINTANVTNNVNVAITEGETPVRDDDASYTNTIPTGAVIVHHVDTNSNPVAPNDDPMTGLYGVGYTTSAKTNIYGYTWNGQNPDKYVGNYTNGTIDVYYVYNNKSGFVTDEINKENPTNVSSLLDSFTYHITYNATVNEFVGTATLLITDTPQYKIDLSKDHNFDGGDYNEATNTITWTVSNIALNSKDYTITFDKTINFYYIADDITSGVTNTVNSTLTYGTETSTDTDTTDAIEVEKQDVWIAYVNEEDDSPISESDLLVNDYIGKSYNATGNAKTIHGYTWNGQNPTNVTGTIAEDPTIVVFKYTKNPGTLEDETYTKVLENETTALESLENGFEYHLTYSAEVTDFVGTATLTVTDTPSVKIDENKSNNFDGGTYDSSTNTITWTVTKEITENTELRFDKTIKIFYVIDEVTGEISNTANFKVDLDENTPTDEDVTITDEVKKSSITEVYVYEDGGTEVELDRKDTVTDYVGKPYTAEVKDIYGYTWKETQNDTDKFLSTDTTIKHIYTKNDGKISDVELEKNGDTDKKAIDEDFNYTIDYTAKVSEFVGDGVVTITDTLPFAVDTTNEGNVLDGGTLSEDGKTITWTENINIPTTAETNEADRVVTISKTIKLFYTGIDTEEVINEVSATITVGATSDPVTDNHTTPIASGTVIVHHVDTDGSPVAPNDDPMTGLSGTDYTTSAKDNIYGYTWNGQNPDKYQGQYNKETIDVYYVYNNKSGSVTDEVTKTNPDVSTLLESFEYHITYNATVDEFVGTATLIIKDTPQYKIDLSKDHNFDGGDYDEATNTITWTVSNIALNSKDYTITFDRTINFYYLADEVTSNVTNTVTSKLAYGTETSEDTYTTDEVELDKSDVWIAYVDEQTNEPISESGKLINDYVGKSYNATGKAKTIHGYTWNRQNPDNVTGTIAEDPTIVVFKYTKNPGTLEDETYTKVLENKKTALESLENGFEYHLTYSAEVTDFVGTATLTVTDTPSVKIDENKSNNFDGGSYDSSTNTITWTVTKEVTENTELTFDKTITIFYKVDEVTGEISNTANFKVDLDENTPTDEDVTITDEVKKSSITEVYVYKNSNEEVELDRSDTVTDYVGKPYESTVLDFYGYTYSTTENDITSFQKDDTVIKHIYTKNAGEITDEKPVKTAPESVDSITSAFKYTLSYSATINDYVGTAKTTFIDTLPYAIDEEKSDLAGGVYDSEALTITWAPVETEIDEENRTISITKNITLYYIGIDSSEIENDFNVETNYDANTSKTDTDATTTVKTGRVIVHHVDIDGNPIIDDEIFEGLVGETYTTKEKDFGEYYLEDFNGETEGTYIDGDIEVTYIYNLSGIGDIEPPQTGFSAVEYFAAYSIRYIITLLLLVVVSKVKKHA